MNEFIIEEYHQCYESKKHYDNLSWTIAGVTLVLVGSLVAFLVNRGTCIDQVSLVALRVLGTVLISVWYFVYERNRFWVEVANERARDIERALAIDGLTIQFMIANRKKKVTLWNVDSRGVGEEKPKTEALYFFVPSMHWCIRILAVAMLVAIWFFGW